MDDRMARGREDVNRERRVPQPPEAPDSSRNGRGREADGTSADRRSSPAKPPLTKREREERWPLG